MIVFLHAPIGGALGEAAFVRSALTDRFVEKPGQRMRLPVRRRSGTPASV